LKGAFSILDHIIVPSAEFSGLGAKQIEEYKGSLYRMYGENMIFVWFALSKIFALWGG
jgi:hypothetical protein